MSISPGSDVNSMDSVDSGCTMGAGESQTNRTASTSSELVVWEIEVPKVSQHNQRQEVKQTGHIRLLCVHSRHEGNCSRRLVTCNVRVLI